MADKINNINDLIKFIENKLVFLTYNHRDKNYYFSIYNETMIDIEFTPITIIIFDDDYYILGKIPIVIRESNNLILRMLEDKLNISLNDFNHL